MSAPVQSAPAQSASTMCVFGLAGWSGSGKTTLIRRLLPALLARGFSVSTVKHAHHKFDMATPKEGDRQLRAAGVDELMLVAPARWALLHEAREGPEFQLEDLIVRLTPVDLLLIEGFKSHPHPKLEVYRPADVKPLLANGDPKIVGVAVEGGRLEPGVLDHALPVFDLDDIEAIVGMILTHCGLNAAPDALKAG
jgi:molybdopterin-guanine dinucleotide biosynthesis protein MobB